MIHDELLSNAEWDAKIAEIGANSFRMVGVFRIVAEQYPMYAKQYRAYFMALTTEGFTPEQALEIVKAHGWVPR